MQQSWSQALCFCANVRMWSETVESVSWRKMDLDRVRRCVHIFELLCVGWRYQKGMRIF